MGALQRWQLISGLILAGITAMVQSAEAHSPDAGASFTVQIHDYAEVEPKQLAEAKRVAAAIFEKAGVVSSWMEGDTSEKPNSHLVEQGPSRLSYIYVHILPQSMAGQIAIRSNTMGWAPGSGPDRTFVYVFYDRVEKFAAKTSCPCVSQILGEVIAHEIGHILLNLTSHSQAGIMRGDWGLKDMQDVVYGSLLFTQRQAEVIRAEVIRRASEGNRIHFALQPFRPIQR